MILRTVLGDTDVTGGGAVLPHEHLVIDYQQMSGRVGPVTAEVEDECVALLARARESGVAAIVDCTPPGYGRDLDFLRTVSLRSGVPIVASTGTFCEQWNPQPQWVQTGSEADNAAAFVAELGRGCGVIKLATSQTPTAGDLAGLAAGALAHVRTGAPIVSHTTGGYGLQQLELFAAHGVDLAKVLVSHVCAADEPIEYAIGIARRGAYVGLDRIGHSAHDDDHWIGIIRALSSEGLADRILLGHDSVQRFRGPDAIAGHTFSDLTYLTSTFTRKALAGGVTASELRLMTVQNPLTWLEPKRVAA